MELVRELGAARAEEVCRSVGQWPCTAAPDDASGVSAGPVSLSSGWQAKAEGGDYQIP